MIKTSNKLMDWYILISDSVHACQDSVNVTGLTIMTSGNSTLHIYLLVPSINQFHSKTSELLSENKT